MDLVNDMVQAVNPSDKSVCVELITLFQQYLNLSNNISGLVKYIIFHMQALKDELIVDLVEQCRSNQKKLIQMLTTTASVFSTFLYYIFFFFSFTCSSYQ